MYHSLKSATRFFKSSNINFDSHKNNSRNDYQNNYFSCNSSVWVTSSFGSYLRRFLLYLFDLVLLVKQKVFKDKSSCPRYSNNLYFFVLGKGKNNTSRQRCFLTTIKGYTLICFLFFFGGGARLGANIGRIF